MLRVPVREDRLDHAARCAKFVDLGCELHPPVQRVQGAVGVADPGPVGVGRHTQDGVPVRGPVLMVGTVWWWWWRSRPGGWAGTATDAGLSPGPPTEGAVRAR